jgi:hypothetical protein
MWVEFRFNENRPRWVPKQEIELDVHVSFYRGRASLGAIALRHQVSVLRRQHRSGTKAYIVP